jgi:hypothetical protein
MALTLCMPCSFALLRSRWSRPSPSLTILLE